MASFPPPASHLHAGPGCTPDMPEQETAAAEDTPRYPMEQSPGYLSQRRRAMLRPSFTLLLITLIFFLSWVPTYFGDHLRLFNAKMVRNAIFIQYAINPGLYYFTKKKHREEARQLLRNWWRQRFCCCGG